MMINKLKLETLSGDKTELLVVNARHRPTPAFHYIYAGTDHITASISATNMVSMNKQIASICKYAFCHLNNVAKIRTFISFQH